MSTYDDALRLSRHMAGSQQIRAFTPSSAVVFRKLISKQGTPELTIYFFTVTREDDLFIVLSLQDWTTLTKLAQEVENFQRAMGGAYTNLGQIQQRARNINVMRREIVVIHDRDWQQLCRLVDTFFQADIASAPSQQKIIYLPPIDSHG